MKNADEDRILIEQIKRGWGPPAGDADGFDAAGRRVRWRQTRSRWLRYGVCVCVLLLVGLAVGLTNHAQRTPSTDWIALTAAGQTTKVDLPPEYEALFGTIYGEGNTR